MEQGRARRAVARRRQDPPGEARRGDAVRDEAARHLDGAPGALLAAFPDKRRVEMGETGTGRQEGDGERAGEASMQPIPGTETCILKRSLPVPSPSPSSWARSWRGASIKGVGRR